jgi:hypothetical protein
MNNPGKPATQGTQYEEKYNTTCAGHHHTQTNTNNVNKTRYKYEEVNAVYTDDNLNPIVYFNHWIFYCRICRCNS